jgi:hypothetical protein
MEEKKIQIVIPDEKLLLVIFELLFFMRSELQAVRDVVAQIYFEKTGDGDLIKYYEEKRKESEKALIRQIRAHYTGFDVDALIRSIVK